MKKIKKKSRKTKTKVKKKVKKKTKFHFENNKFSKFFKAPIKFKN